MKTIPPKERGAALLTVLLLVAVMAVVSASAVERLTLATRLAGSAGAIAQARYFTFAAEDLAMRRIATQLAREPGKVTADGDWVNRPFTLPLPGGQATLTLTDGGNCFNLNSLVAESTVGGNAQRPLALEQFTALMQALQIDRATADRITAGAADWIDADQNTSPLGAEDSDYARQSPAYRTGDRAMADASELSGVAGVTPVLMQRLAPWVCALPTNDLSPINVNTLLPEQAPLLQMLTGPQLSATQARSHLAARPRGGYSSVNRFWSAPTLAGITPTGDAASQAQVTTRWFRLKSEVHLGDVTLVGESLIDARQPPFHIVRRRWGPDS